MADIGAGVYTAWKMYQIYKIVRRIITVIVAIQKTFEEISKAVKKIGEDVDAVKKLLHDPEMPHIPSVTAPAKSHFS
ncbi:hypothetical protein [Gandjariella thermophila]|uniref:Uncharacterized protein n=1 Tax=Gandjariella thermophila TaxID=1931992 RepID=A0A4D4J0T1_9PSEU|nr:hypothetical protein [Gandjariella thermophila]GDY30071.1 hypothetical protein GTS_17040 [Gandjariella thermophila]